MDDQDNQDESDQLRSYAPNAMAIDHADYLEPVLTSVEGSSISPVMESNSVAFHEQKWSRLRRHYNDQYLELFRMAPGDDDEDAYSAELPTTQLGAVVWQPSEKAALYRGLCRKGRRDLQGLSALVGSKSEVEVKAYLDSLQEQETDRQLFEPQTKNLSHADIPAAIEIGPECETVLEHAADALAAFQEQYDHAVGQRNSTLWLVDQATASVLDQKATEAGAASDVSGHGSDIEGDSDDAASLFHLSTFLALSEQFFMNQGSDGPNNWRNLAEEGQRPAMTVDVVTNFHDLVVNLTRRLVQSCLFMAQSRIRASTTANHKPSKLVRFEDVAAAQSVLNIKANADAFWIGMARRNQLSVVTGSHRKNIGRHTVLSYEQVEVKLSIPKRRRSASAASEDSMRSRASSADSFAPSERENEGGETSDSEDEPFVATEDSVSPVREGNEGMSSSSNEQSEPASSEDRPQPSAPMSRQKRIQLLEEEQDEYMERMDQEARKLEECRLLQLLGVQSEGQIKSEEASWLGARPRVMRKSAQECMGWSVQYQAEWESLGEVLPPESFTEAGSRAKRRKPNPEGESGAKTQ